jgi:glutathione S-transferase
MYRAGRLDWPDPPVTPLELYGARLAPDFSGWWVYALADKPGSAWSDGRVWYAGQSDHLWSRLRDHYYKFGARFTAADKWLVPVAHEAEADLIELVHIHFYQPECNDKGRASDLAAKVRRWGRGTKEFDSTVHQRALDRSKVTS